MADRLALPFVDADRLLEARDGRSIPQIFADDGEPFFRDLEETILAELHTQAAPIVLATGGGSILRERNRLGSALGAVVWLSAKVETLVDRLTRDLNDRPALTSAGAIAEIAEIVAKRAGFYRETAHFEVETDDIDPREVAEIVLERLETISTISLK